jgi:hypothetical protein
MKYLIAIVLMLGMGSFAYAQDAASAAQAQVAASATPQMSVAPAIVAPVVAPAALEEETPADKFLGEVFEQVKAFGGFDWAARVIVVITILISSMKVSFMKKLLWDKLPAMAKFAAPATLALIAGLIDYVAHGGFSWSGLAAWALAGQGAMLLHHFLDAVKELPFVGPKYDAMIDIVQGWLNKAGVGAKKA